MPKNELYKTWDSRGYPLHIKNDMETHNKNLADGWVLCEDCDGTGNYMYSMYQRCQQCLGNGHTGRKKDVMEQLCISLVDRGWYDIMIYQRLAEGATENELMTEIMKHCGGSENPRMVVNRIDSIQRQRNDGEG